MNQASLDFSGRDIGHAKAQAAAKHAGAEWQDLALAALHSFAQAHRQFTVEDVRSAHPDIKAPTDKAWGAIALRARKEMEAQISARIAARAHGCFFVAQGEADSVRVGA